MRRLKKVFEAPRLHIVEITTDKSMSVLAGMTDEELQRELEKSGFYENRVRHSAADTPIPRVIAEAPVVVPVNKKEEEFNSMVTFTEALENSL